MSQRVRIRRKRPTDAPESDWDGTIADYADLMGWKAWHVPDSRWMKAGLPDWILIRGGRVRGDTGTGGGPVVEPTRVVFAELKVPGGRVRPEQARVLELLRSCPGVEVYLWTLPDAWPDIRELLR